MGSIYQRTPGGTWYYQWYRHGKLHKKSLKTTNKALATSKKKINDGTLERSALGLTPKRAKLQLSFDGFLKEKEGKIAPETMIRYRQQVAILHGFFSEEKIEFLDQITNEHISRYIVFRQKGGRANKTIDDERFSSRG